MKHNSPLRMSILLGFGLCLGATSAFADPHVQVTVPQNQTATLGDMVGSDTLEDVATIMHDRGVNSVPVLDADGKVVGIVARADIVRFIARTT